MMLTVLQGGGSLGPWIPMEWPAEWSDPAHLSLLRESSINCLLCSAEPTASLQAAAKDASISCLGPVNPVVSWAPLKEVEWQTAKPVVGISDALWPRLETRRGNNSHAAGPTGTPWLDANGWIIQLARTRGRGKPVWVRSAPPAEVQVLSAADYLLALHEAAAFGARRPVWLSAVDARQLAQGDASAKQTWSRIKATLKWWDSHRAWADWPVQASLLVVSDFSGPNEFMSGEALNLAARRNLAFRAIETGSVDAAALRGIKAVLYLDEQAPPKPLLAQLQKYVQDGGLLLAQKTTAAQLAGLLAKDETHARFITYKAGKGRVAEAKHPWEDPYLLALDTHLLMSRRHDAVRLFNGGSLNLHHVVSPDGRTSVVHLLNYAKRPASHTVVLHSQRPVRAARWIDPDKTESTQLTIAREMGRYEVALPPIAVYAAIEMEHAT